MQLAFVVEGGTMAENTKNSRIMDITLTPTEPGTLVVSDVSGLLEWGGFSRKDFTIFASKIFGKNRVVVRLHTNRDRLPNKVAVLLLKYLPQFSPDFGSLCDRRKTNRGLGTLADAWPQA